MFTILKNNLYNDYFDFMEIYKEKYGEKTIIFLQNGPFIEMYERQKTNSGILKEISKTCDLIIRETDSESDILMCSFKDYLIDKQIEKLQNIGYTIVFYIQENNHKNSNFKFEQIFSSGTYLSEENNTISNHITCIWINYVESKIFHSKMIVVGISSVDIVTGKTNIYEFKELYYNNPSTYDNLEYYLSVYNPNETIIISNLPLHEMNNIINFASIQSKKIHKICIDKKTNTTISNQNGSGMNDNIMKCNNCQKQVYQREIFSRFYNAHYYNEFAHSFEESPIASQSLCFLLDFIHQHNPYLVKKISEPSFEKTFVMKLNNQTLKQLNMINETTESLNTHELCVSKLLNKCITPMGKRSFLSMLLNPSTNIDFLNNEYNITSYMCKPNNEKILESIMEKLSEITDMHKLMRQCILHKISPKMISQLYKNIVYTLDLCNDLLWNSDKIINYLSLRNIDFENVRLSCMKCIEFIDKHMDINIAKTIHKTSLFDSNFIHVGVDKELDEKTKLLNESMDKLQAIREYFDILLYQNEKQQDKSKETKVKTKMKANEKTAEGEKDATTSTMIKLEETIKNNLYLVATHRRCNLLKTEFANIVGVSGRKTITLNYYSSFYKLMKSFELNIDENNIQIYHQNTTHSIITNSEIDELCNTASTLKVELKYIISNVYKKILAKFADYHDNIDTISNLVSCVDVMCTKAHIAKRYNLCKPVIHADAPKSFLNATQLRHILIENMQKDEIYVGNNIVLGTREIERKQDGILLFGTNAVGKTCFMKSVGIAVIMAQAGLFVPCTTFVYKPYENIFTRINRNDNMFKGLSTFEVEISELRLILNNANENSLILADELCSGTEYSSAISIFVSTLQDLYKRKSSFIFTTHLHPIIYFDEVTVLDTINAKHMEVVYDKEKDVLVYNRKLVDGGGSNMYGLEVSKSLRLPDAFLENAFQIRAKYFAENTSVLAKKTSRYNKDKILGICELCMKNPGTEIHHLTYQKDANETGVINDETTGKVFHKNNLANLVSICESCHESIHDQDLVLEKVKTNRGYKILTKTNK